VEATSPTGALSPEVELALYRILQEALSNVVRHAGASHARVRIGRADGVVEAIVEDDGRGFRVDRVLSAGDAGLGLFGMKERAASLGGDVRVESEPGRGTRVSVRIPVGKGEANG
jgi:two-component system sensor histidine kinase UhpB